MVREVDNFYLNNKEPNKSCFLAIRKIIYELDSNISETVRYSMPCFRFKNKAFCYLWSDKKTNEPYILFVEGKHLDHPQLEAGSRKRMKIFRINPKKDLQLNTISKLLRNAIDLYR